MTSFPPRPHLQKLAALTAATLTVTALAQSVQAQTTVNPVPPTSSTSKPVTTSPAVIGQPTPEQAQQIIERLSGMNAGPTAPGQVVYGAVPAGLPLKFSGPIEVLASFRAVYGNNVAYRILLGTAAETEAASTSLHAQMLASGWRPFGSNVPRPGFISAQTEVYRNYYYEKPGDAGGYTSGVNITSRGGRTNIDLSVNSAPAAQIAQMKKYTVPPQSSLPTLKPLPGAKIKVGYGGGGPNGLMSTAHVTGTTLSANEVLAFYNTQLKTAGWKAVTDTTNGPLRVITYNLKDGNGREALGTLGIRPWEKEGGGYVLTASVQGFKP